MRILNVNAPNATPAIGESAIPIPAEGQMQIEIAATALNFADVLMIQNLYQNTPAFPLTPGMEIAGRVTALAKDVTAFNIGDRVAAILGHGGLAEFATVTADRAVRIPDNMDDATAAAVQITYSTAHIALNRRARLAAGDTLVVLGAAGGAGLAAVEVAKAIGATVIVVARGADRLAVAKRSGADILIDSATQDITEALRLQAPFDVVYDTIGGETGTAAARFLKPEGRHLLIGFARGDHPTLKPNHLLVKNVEVIGVNISAYPTFNPTALTDSLTEIFDWHGKGLIRPHIGHRFRLDQAVEALDLLKTRKATGKIVVTP